MATTRFQVLASDRRFFRALEDWAREAGDVPNLFRAAMSPEELRLKRRRFAAMIDKAAASAARPVDLKQDWDHLWAPLCGRATAIGFHHLFTGDRRSAAWAGQVIDAIEACPRPHFTFSTCLGVMDLDLRTAHVAHALTVLRCCVGEELSSRTQRQLDAIVLDRCVRPGLAAMRARRIPWMRNKANWRIILPGMFGLAAMAWRERLPEHLEVIRFAMEGVLAAFSTGDAMGGWNEGPGYWEYGLSHAGIFVHALKTFTGGQVDLFKHPFLRKTGDFRLAMHVRPNEVWNWSDSGKKASSSTLLAILARAYQSEAYQWLLYREGLRDLAQVFYLDPALEHRRQPQPPRTLHFPGCGVVTARTGMGARDTFLGVKAADIPHLNHHCQMDGGSITIHAAGRELLAKLEHWQYPREAPKDPKAPRPSRPGLFDEQLKRYMRWDLDSVGAPGHNIAVIEGHLPQPRLGLKPRLKVLASDDRHDVIAIDSSPYYRPLARKARRLVVFLRPNLFVVVDEIDGVKPLRTRLQFHYHDKARIDGRDIRIEHGRASLLIQPIWPTSDDEIIVGSEDRRTFYHTPIQMVQQRNRAVYVENLWRKKRLVFVTVMQAGDRGQSPLLVSGQGDPVGAGRFSLTFRGRRKLSVEVDLAKSAVKLSRG